MVIEIKALMIGLGALGIGGGLILYRRILDAKAQASLRWPSTKGEITGSEFLASTLDSPSSFKIQYQYQIGSRQYSSNKVHLGVNMATGSNKFNQGIVDKYPQGKSVTVFYNPENHQESFLERQIRGFAMYYMMGIPLIIVGIVFLLAAFGIISISEGGDIAI